MAEPLLLPELREMLAEQNEAEMREFCEALHPARTAEFMAGLEPGEIWTILQQAEPTTRSEIFCYFDLDQQAAMIAGADREEAGRLIADLPADVRVDVLKQLPGETADELLPLLPEEDRRDIFRLRAYPEGTAGAVMTTDFARLREDQTVGAAIEELRRQKEELETIFYLYVVDSEDHLRGLVSLRDLVFSNNDVRIGDIMERNVVSVEASDDQEDVARTLARFDFLAIPVVGPEHQMLGIVTHDDMIDVVVEEATEDAHRIAAVDPLEAGYLETHLLTLTWKRGLWLTILFFAALLTAKALANYHDTFESVTWLVFFIPLVISSGGNIGNQSATLIITALSTGNITLRDWWRVIWRELAIGVLLGLFLGAIGYGSILIFDTGAADVGQVELTAMTAAVLPLTLILVVVTGALLGSLLPLMFSRLGLDPALMSNPLVAGMIDILGILIYMNVALALLEIQLD